MLTNIVNNKNVIDLENKLLKLKQCYLKIAYY